MAQVIRFFPRQTILGSTTVYSEIYEVAPETVTVLAEYRLWSYSGAGAGAGISAAIETTMNPTFGPDTSWSAVASTGVIAAGVTVIEGTQIMRFVRGKIVAPGATAALLHFEGVTKESS